MVFIPIVINNTHHQENKKRNKVKQLLLQPTRRVEVKSMDFVVVTFEIDKHIDDYKINQKIKEKRAGREVLDIQFIPIAIDGFNEASKYNILY